MSKSKRKVVFYGRVSTKKEEQDSSIVNQEQYFNDRGIKKGYIDRGSGTSIDKRPQFQEMLKECGLDIKKVKSGSNYKSVVIDTGKESKIGHIYTKSISRFARNVSDAVDICSMLHKKQTYVIFEDINKSTADDSFFMTMGILATIAENESREKSRSIKMGSSMTAKQGKVRSVGAYGYKYNKEDNTLKAIPEEAEIVRLIFELKANKGYGGRRIANELNSLGYKPKKGEVWKPHVINRIVKNPIYFGATVRNRYDTNKLFGENNHKLKSEDEWIIIMNNKVEAIIDKDTFDKAQEVRRKYTSEVKTKTGKWVGRGELAGKIICDKCHQAYTKNKDTKIREYGRYERVFYNCSTKKRYGKSECDNPNVSQEDIDKLLNIYIGKKYKEVCNRFLDLFIKKANESTIRLKESMSKDNKLEIENNNNRILELKEKLSKVLLLYIDGNTPKDVLDNIKEPLELEIKELETINSRLSECDDKILDKINKVEHLKEVVKVFVNRIPEEVSREEFIEEYLISISVNRNGELGILTKIHGFYFILTKMVGVASGDITEFNQLGVVGKLIKSKYNL